tara:strand:- start:417 stop:1157 length:741 start_codon:yes stop_codon:yes gene_type:complete
MCLTCVSGFLRGNKHQVRGFASLRASVGDFEPTPKQKKYIDLLEDNKTDLILANGFAGTGKSWLACKHAISHLKTNKVKRIVITRPLKAVEGEDIGYLPGDVNDKLSPWLLNLFDFFIKEGGKQKLESMIKCGTVEIAPLGFMRGRTFDDCFVIADEMQNSTPMQMKMMLTRIGKNSKVVITGDKSQSDLDKIDSNGLEDFYNKLIQHYETNTWEMYKEGIGIVDFGIEDVKRSDICKKILEIYNE